MKRDSVTSAAMYVGGFVAFGCGVPDYREVNELYADSDGGAMRWRFCEAHYVLVACGSVGVLVALAALLG
jgi:hypothetical protein